MFTLSWSHCLPHAYAQDCVGLLAFSFENKMFIACAALLEGWAFYLVTTAGLLSIIKCYLSSAFNDTFNATAIENLLPYQKLYNRAWQMTAVFSILPETLISCLLNCMQVTDIKRFNNMMSDHGIYSRERLLIPISNPKILLGSTCYIEMDHNAKREVAIFYPEGRPGGKTESAANIFSAERRSKRILDSVRRSLHVDDGTAAYYLSVTEGDPRAAMMEYSEDLRWEKQRTGQ